MATITIRNLDPETKDLLRVQAARNGRSMEAEARAVLDEAVRAKPARGLGSRIRNRFADIDASIDVPPRSEPARAVAFDE